MTSDHLLIDLNSGSGNQLLAVVANSYGSGLAGCAQFVDQIFLLRSHDAPGLRFVGGLADGVASNLLHSQKLTLSLTGSDETIEGALATCIGEGVERLSQIERPEDVVCKAPWKQLVEDLAPGLQNLLIECEEAGALEKDAVLAWLQGRCLQSERTVYVPADWCLRRPNLSAVLKPRTALSTGAAAGKSFEDAAIRAILELIERHAVHFWWLAGKRGRSFPLESEAINAAHTCLKHARQHTTRRSTNLIDISVDIDVPTVAAMSFNADGTGFCCGTATRLSPEDAVQAAIGELCQMEMGLNLAIAKEIASKGDNKERISLSQSDQDHLARASKIHADDCVLTHPSGISHTPSTPLQKQPLEHLKALLDDVDVSVALVELTRPNYGIPVVFAFAPKLLPVPSYFQANSSKLAITHYGGGSRWTKGVLLS